MPAGYAGRLNGLYSRKWNRVTKNKKDSELVMLRFLAVQLSATTPASCKCNGSDPGVDVALISS